MKYSSVHILGDEIVDCRNVLMEFDFFNATQSQTKEIVKFCITEMCDLLGDAFYLDWVWNNRRKKQSNLLDAVENVSDVCRFSFDGNTMLSGINNHSAILRYNRELEQKLTYAWDNLDYSEDYWELYNELFSNVSAPNEIKQKLMQLFNIENRYYRQRWFGEEVSGSFYSYPYMLQKDFYCGHFEFQIALLCLGDNVLEFMTRVINFIQQIPGIVSDSNGRIALSPMKPVGYCSHHMEYFGGAIKSAPANQCSCMRQTEWIRYYYLRGVEWYNLLSPHHTSMITRQQPDDNMLLCMLPNGGCTIRAKKDLIQTQVSDLCSLKRFLYPILYPGGCTIPIAHLLNPHSLGFLVKPRREWENIPVLEHEIEAFSDRIVLKHQALNDV